jgi:hypothetical protein
MNGDYTGSAGKYPSMSYERYRVWTNRVDMQVQFSYTVAVVQEIPFSGSDQSVGTADEDAERPYQKRRTA